MVCRIGDLVPDDELDGCRQPARASELDVVAASSMSRPVTKIVPTISVRFRSMKITKSAAPVTGRRRCR
jgi:hypothetical protein